METLNSYTDEVKDIINDTLKASLKGISALTFAVGHVEDEYSNKHIPNQPGENSIPSASKDGSLDERVASLKQPMVKIVAFVREEKLRRNEKKKKRKTRYIYILLNYVI